MDGHESLLEARARKFGRELLETLQRTVESNAEEFDWTVTQLSNGNQVGTLRSTPGPQIKLFSKAGDQLIATFGIAVEFKVFFDDYLTVQESSIAVGLGDSERDEPIFRYEYVRSPRNPALPVAHLHVHGHRDEFIHGMLLSSAQRPKDRWKKIEKSQLKAKLPTMSQVHFPLGGPRLRPGLEDVIHLLITEFGVASKPGWYEFLNQRRREWRTLQLRALIHRNPDLAAEVLSEKGYSVEAPQGHQGSPPDPALTRF